jgi:hypothetical protein
VRRFTVTPDAHSVVIEDRIENGRGQTATARFLFHPDCALVVEGERARIRRANVEIELIAEAPLRRSRPRGRRTWASSLRPIGSRCVSPSPTGRYCAWAPMRSSRKLAATPDPKGPDPEPALSIRPRLTRPDGAGKRAEVRECLRAVICGISASRP